MWDCHFILTFKKLGQMLVSALWHRIGQQARVNLGEKCKTYFKTTREGKVKAKAKIGNDFKDIRLWQTAQGEWVGHGQSGFRSISHGTSNPNCLTWCPGCRCRRSCESWGCSLQFKVPFCSKCYVVPRSVLFYPGCEEDIEAVNLLCGVLQVTLCAWQAGDRVAVLYNLRDWVCSSASSVVADVIAEVMLE